MKRKHEAKVTKIIKGKKWSRHKRQYVVWGAAGGKERSVSQDVVVPAWVTMSPPLTRNSSSQSCCMRTSGSRVWIQAEKRDFTLEIQSCPVGRQSFSAFWSLAGWGQDDSKLYVCDLLVAPMSTLLWSDMLSRKSSLNNDSCDRFQPSGSALIDAHWQMDRMSISWSVFISILLDGIGIGWSTENSDSKIRDPNSVLFDWPECSLENLLVELQLMLCESMVYESTAPD